MEPVHIFYKELPIDQNNTFTANITQENEVEKAKFKKSREYAVTGLSINQDIGSSVVAITDTDRQDEISNFMLKLVKEKKEPPFSKKKKNKKQTATELSPIKLTFYNTTTKCKKRLNFLIK